MALPEQPLIVAYGLEVDSTALLIGLDQLGIRTDPTVKRPGSNFGRSTRSGPVRMPAPGSHIPAV